MSNLKRVDRLAERVGEISREAEDAAVAAAGPGVVESAFDFKHSHGQAILLATQERKSRKEREAMEVSFGSEHNKAISCIKVYMPYAELPEKASQMATGDDLLNGGKTIDELVLNVAGVDENHPLDGQGDQAPTGEPWAIRLGQRFDPQLVEATKIYSTSVTLSKKLQKALDERATKRQVFEERLVHFRRLIRDAFGPRSHEYHRLRERGSTDDNGDGTPVVPPAPAPGDAPTVA